MEYKKHDDGLSFSYELHGQKGMIDVTIYYDIIKGDTKDSSYIISIPSLGLQTAPIEFPNKLSIPAMKKRVERHVKKISTRLK